MKSYFLFVIGGLAALALVGWFLWLVGRSVHTLYSDWQLARELDELTAESQSRREARAEADRQRLDNGCEHAFDDPFGAFPPGACRKCGLEQQRPAGPCDHVWRRTTGPVLSSRCEKCGKTFQAQLV